MGAKLTTEEFIIKAIAKHGDKYDYDKVTYLSSLIDVLVKCKKHNEYFNITPKAHLRGVGCKKCWHENVISSIKHDLNWFVTEAKKVHGDRYGYDLSNYTGMHEYLIIHCYDHGDFPQTPNNHIAHKQNCPYCMGSKKTFSLIGSNKISIKRVRSSVKTKTNSEVSALLLEKNIKNISDYIKSHDKMDLQCLICLHQWPATFHSVCGINDSGCPKCNDAKLTSADVDNFLIKNNIKIKRLDDYLGALISIRWLCLKCDKIWSTQPTNIINNRTGCKNCSRGKNEGIVRDFLINNNIEFEYLKIKLPINKNYTLPDFYIPSLNLIIEYNGRQHYEPVCFGGTAFKKAENNFEKQHFRDEQMREYCINSGINLLEIDGRKYTNLKLINYLCEYFKIDNSNNKTALISNY